MGKARRFWAFSALYCAIRGSVVVKSAQISVYGRLQTQTEASGKRPHNYYRNNMDRFRDAVDLVRARFGSGQSRNADAFPPNTLDNLV
jgi:hypothetical protein